MTLLHGSIRTLKKVTAMIRNDGEYYYAPHRSLWGIWRWNTWKTKDGAGKVIECGCGEFVKDCVTKKKAREEVYRLNNWKKN